MSAQQDIAEGTGGQEPPPAARSRLLGTLTVFVIVFLGALFGLLISYLLRRVGF